MMSNETILPDSVAIFPHIQAFDLAAKAWVDDLKLEALLVYIIDQVDEKALYSLAEQFDVLGYKGWKLASTVDDRRSLIKRAIELHRFKGTVWAVKEAMKSIGFTDAVILEHVNGHWANLKCSYSINRCRSLHKA
jgi:P2-related tail formation protein